DDSPDQNPFRFQKVKRRLRAGLLHMKFRFKGSIPALLAAVLFGVSPGHAQILVKVDTTKPWVGFMNVFELPSNGGAYVFGSVWGTKDLSAYFTGTSTLTLTRNTNVYNATNTFWVQPEGSGNKNMEANFYV